jgi:hypothetical protein
MRRRTYIVDKKLQYRLLGYNAIYFFITITAFSLALFTPLIFEISDPTLSPHRLPRTRIRARVRVNKSPTR